MAKKYRVDENNRLVVRDNGKETSPDGKWVIGENNLLKYILSEPQIWRAKSGLPEEITFEGNWSLNKNHDLIFTLNQTHEQGAGDELYFKAELLDTKGDALIFSLGTIEKSGISEIRLLALKGKWQANQYNRLQFLIQKAGTRYDALTFQGAWEVNRNNTLVYTYKKTYLKRKEKIDKTLAFKGYWQISDKNRLAYILDIENNSLFSFKCSLQTPSIIARSGEIRYSIGLGVKGKELWKVKVLTLYGIWKLDKKAGLSFEIDYGSGRISEMRFGVNYQIDNKNEIIFQLKNSQDHDLGLSVTFNRTFLKRKAKWFLRLAKEERESRIEGGITIPW